MSVPHISMVVGFAVETNTEFHPVQISSCLNSKQAGSRHEIAAALLVADVELGLVDPK